MTKEKACRTCRLIVDDEKTCPGCGGNAFTTFWRGYIVIIKPEESEMAKKMGITKPGKYALRLSR